MNYRSGDQWRRIDEEGEDPDYESEPSVDSDEEEHDEMDQNELADIMQEQYVVEQEENDNQDNQNLEEEHLEEPDESVNEEQEPMEEEEIGEDEENEVDEEFVPEQDDVEIQECERRQELVMYQRDLELWYNIYIIKWYRTNNGTYNESLFSFEY